MRICVVGAGAIGGLMGAKLALGGEEVTVIDQGAHLAAIRENGLKLIWEDGGEHKADVKAVGSFEERSEEHTSELQSLMRISYAVFCLKKKRSKQSHTQKHIHK